jgi:type I restriction enzyme S subunit
VSDELPTGWIETRVGDLFASHGGGTPNRATATYWNGNIPWLSSGDIKATSISESSETITKRGLEESAARLCRKGSVLVVVRSGILKHTLPVAVLECEASINQDIKAFDSGDDQLNAWLALAWRASARKLLVENREGTTVQSVKLETLNDFVLPLAPLAEQRRIVAKLETLLGKVDASQQRLAKIPVLLKRFRQSVLAAACSGRLTADWREENSNVDNASGLVAELERVHKAAGGHRKGNAAEPSDEAHDLSADGLPSTWRLTEMRSVVCPDRPITYGILKPGPETPGGIPYIRVADFPNDRLNLETIRRTTKEIEKTFARARLRPGDILLSIRGTVGRVCVVPPELENANITQDTARLSVQPALNAGFVKWFLRAAPTQKRMQKAVKGVAVRGINIGDVRALQMPVAPLPEQQEIVRRVEGLFALADQLEERLAKARRQVDKLTPSLLARAFAGQLVPQNPTDEPAIELLKRIKLKG